MRFILLLLLGSLPSFVLADNAASQPQPAGSTAGKLEPLPPPPEIDSPSTDNPSSSNATTDDASNEPEVTITKKSDQTIEEYRIGGRLYMIKITPKIGPPYYLVDDRGDGKFSRQDSLDTGFRPPRWVIKKF